MLFEWDENKRQLNLKKHGLDFKYVEIVFMDKDKYDVIDNRKDYGEERIITVGMYDGLLLASVCHTDRNGVKRVISFRHASKKERSEYYARKNSKIYK